MKMRKLIVSVAAVAVLATAALAGATAANADPIDNALRNGDVASAAASKPTGYDVMSMKAGYPTYPDQHYQYSHAPEARSDIAPNGYPVYTDGAYSYSKPAVTRTDIAPNGYPVYTDGAYAYSHKPINVTSGTVADGDSGGDAWLVGSLVVAGAIGIAILAVLVLRGTKPRGTVASGS